MKLCWNGATNMQKYHEVYFATSNLDKFREAKITLSKFQINIKRAAVKDPEIQSTKIEEIAKASVVQAIKHIEKKMFVEDTGLFIEALNGFPGPYSSYVHDTLGNNGILKLLKGFSNRRAVFRSAIAFGEPNDPIRCFVGCIKGNISTEEHGEMGFGYDPIFKPIGGGGKTFAEMTIVNKSKYSHRSRALEQFADWYINNCKINSPANKP